MDDRDDRLPPGSMLPARVLPRDAVALLVRASQVTDPKIRLIAIDSAIDRIKTQHPAYFRQERRS